MAKPTITYRSSVYSTTNSSPYTAAPTWTPADNSLVVAFVIGTAVSPADPTGVTGHGLTYSKLTLSANTISTTHICSIWVADCGVGPASTACVASFGGSPLGCAIIEFEITGWPQADGPASAFGKDSLINTGTATTGTTGTVTLDLHPDVTSELVEMSFWCHLANEATTPRVNWTETAGADGNFTNNATGAEGQFRTDAFELTATATWTTTINWRGYAFIVRGTATTPVENVHVVDTVTAILNPLQGAPSTENVHVVEDLGPNPRLSTTLWMPILTESVRVMDFVDGAAAFVASQNTRTAGLHEAHLKLADTVTAVNGINYDIVLPTEALKLADTVTVDYPLQPGLLTETLFLSDQPPFISERLRLADSAVTAALVVSNDLSANVGAENLKLSDTVLADENPRDVSVGQELLHVTETLAVVLDPLQGAPGNENVKIADGPALADENPRDLSVGTETLHVVDTLTATRDLTASLEDDIKLADGPVVGDENPRPVLVAQDVLLLADTVTAIRDLTASVQEDIKVQDTVVADENPRDISIASETLHVVDTVTAALDPLLATLSDEVIRVVDGAVVADENPRPVLVAAETLLLADTLTAARGLTATLADETLFLNDGPVVGDENPRPVLVSGEVIKIADTLAASRDIEASPTETLRLADTVSADENPRDVPVATDAFRIADTVTTSLDPLQGVPADENVKIADTVTAVMIVDLSASASESLRVMDFVLGAARFVASQNTRTAGLQEDPLKLGETVTASVGLSTALPDETLHVQDTVSADENPRPVLVTTEALLLADGPVLATLDPLEASRTETLKIAETVAADENPRDLSVAAENVHVVDTVSAIRDLTVVVGDESLKLADGPPVGDENPRPVAVAGENVHVVDSIAASRDLTASLSEALVVADAVTAAPDQMTASLTDSARIAESLAVVLDPLETPLVEAVHVVDSVAASLDELVVIAEALRVADAIAATLDPLQAAIAEAIKVGDSTPPDVDIGATRIVIGETLKVADVVVARVDLVVTLTEPFRLADVIYVNGIPLMALRCSAETLSGDVVTVELLSGDIATDEMISGDILTDEVLEPA